MSKSGNVKGWFTVNGIHIPIMEGETKHSAFKRAIDKLKYKKVKNNKNQKNTSSSINAKYDKKQEELYNRLGKKDTIAARQDYDREYNRLERARKKELDAVQTSTSKSYSKVKRVKETKSEKEAFDLCSKVNEASFFGIREYNKRHPDAQITSKDVKEWKEQIRKAANSYVKRNTANFNTNVKIATKRMSTMAKSIPDSAMSGKTSKERRHNLQKYFYDQPKGSKIKVNGITYTKQDNSPGGLWKSKDGNHYSEDLIKEYAHYRKK